MGAPLGARPRAHPGRKPGHLPTGLLGLRTCLGTYTRVGEGGEPWSQERRIFGLRRAHSSWVPQKPGTSCLSLSLVIRSGEEVRSLPSSHSTAGSETQLPDSPCWVLPLVCSFHLSPGTSQEQELRQDTC